MPPSVFCPKCGLLLDVADQICNHCSVAINSLDEKGSTHAPPPPQSRVSVPPPPVIAKKASHQGLPVKPPATKKTNKKKAILIGILIITGIAVITIYINFLKIDQPYDPPPGSTREDPLGVFSD